MPKKSKRLIVAMTGASGAALGVELLKVMKGFPGWETHLVVSAGAEQTLRQECDLTLQELSLLAAHTYDVHNIGAGAGQRDVPRGRNGGCPPQYEDNGRNRQRICG